jgi:hypothetical protein
MIEEKAHGHVRKAPEAKPTREAEVIDFASLLEKSLSAHRGGGPHRGQDRTSGGPQRGQDRTSAANDEDAEEAAPRRGRAGTHRASSAHKTRRKSAHRSGTTHRRAA